MTRRLAAALLTAAALTAVLTACGTAPAAPSASSDTPPAAANAAPNTGGRNDHDVMFLQMMVNHHEQGVAMAEIATEKATSDELKTLASAVVATQKDELTTMKGWLTAWGEADRATTDVNLHADHGGLPATTPEEIESLRNTPAADFDGTFLALFTGHQHNAVEMAKTESTEGSNPDAKALAKSIDDSRTAQIQLMLKISAGTI
ncbi:uncharacterized protein (DUF305 family) [Catenuloplanes nepalensis]|uniref:Uncharacterized protein (DUF305 family) n=1 Tax=Catenuloplanes nepalensis TaxID=587533 RepID=A0ABT9MTN2_9ACTN|nr:DUF305 domain-containing protein [Catenuloplanes nepalensis]MDP9794743.1 uncharacterized protein (DUF305 family) [Catenuloplanes nepalensis]